MASQPFYPQITANIQGQEDNVHYIVGVVTMRMRKANIDASVINAFTEEVMTNDLSKAYDTVKKYVNLVE